LSKPIELYNTKSEPFFFLRRRGARERERKNLKKPPCPARSPMQGSVP